MDTVIAVDSGGTFTDCVVLDEHGNVTTAKAASTPSDFAIGVIASVTRAAELAGTTLGDVLAATQPFSHGTTVATNALITRSGSRVGLITTKGHEDALLIGRTIQKVAGLPDSELTNLAQLEKAVPVVPKPLIKGVTERVDANGTVIVQLDEVEAKEAIDSLAHAGVDAIAVCFLWSFLNPTHEQAVQRLVAANHPDIFVTVSHEVAPVIKEYERGATTVLNAYLSRTTHEYITSLQRQLADGGLRHEPVIMQSTGGVTSAEACKRRAVSLLGSGPAGGVLGAAALGRLIAVENIVTTDVGGTSFDVGLVVDGEPLTIGTPVFDKYHTVLPVVDVASIGAGGGSIAWIEPGTGLLKVGPQSAGAAPGPVCYGTGGTEPTVTDANLVLGRIDPAYFLGGTRPLNLDLATEAIRTRIAEPLGLSIADAAAGIVDILDARMADLVRARTIGRGYDPSQFALFAFGGAGPLHVGKYARDVGAKLVVVPTHSSVFSAFGIAGSDLVHVRQLSNPMTAPFDAARLNELYERLERQVRDDLDASGVAPADTVLSRELEMRYRGQVHDVRVPVPAKVLDGTDVEGVVAEFTRRYDRRFGRGASFDQAGMEARTLLVRGVGRVVKPRLRPEPLTGEDSSAAQVGTRPVYFRELGGFGEVPIYRREQLQSGNRVAGPAIIEAADTTIVVHPRQAARVDEWRNVGFEEDR